MDSDFRAFLEAPDDAKPRPRRRGYNLFGWTVAFLLLSGVVMASWMGSYYVFSHPENPACYHLLKQLNKIDPPKRFEITAAPPGKFLTAKELYNEYITMPRDELALKNDELLRNYLRNYADTKTPVTYVCGDFATTGIRDLDGTDMFPSGIAALADSAEVPQVGIEHIFPTAYANVPRVRQMLATEPVIRLEKTFALSAVVHVEKTEDGKLVFTVLPLTYGKYAFKEGISSTFRLDPPMALNLEAGMPVIKPGAVADAAKNYAMYRKNKGLLAKDKTITIPLLVTAQEPAPSDAPDVPAEAYQPLKPAPAPAVEDQPAPPAPVTELAPQKTIADNTADAAPANPPTPEMPIPVPQPEVAPEPAPVMPPAPEPQTIVSASVQPPAASLPPAALAPQPVSAIATAPVKSVTPVASMPSVVPSTPAIVKTANPQKIVAKVTTPAPPETPQATASAHPTITKPKIAAVAPPVVQKPAAISMPTVAATRQQFLQSVQQTQPTQPAQTAQPAQSVQPPPAYASAPRQETTADGVALEPFIAPAQVPQKQNAAPAPAQATPQTTGIAVWRTYQPGSMPRGRLLTWQDAPALANLGIGNQRLYMQGRFVVTASTEGRAVLRPMIYSGGSVPYVRVVVEYPGGNRAPAEGTQVARGILRPFQVVDVRRGSDGQVNVYAREVTEPLSASSSSNLQYNRYRVVQRENSLY